MRWALRIAGGLLAVVVLVLAVLVWALPRLAKSEAARARIQDATRSVLGAELGYRDLGFGLLPPSLVVHEPELVGDDASAPIARAERVAMRVQLLPLLRRKLEVQSLAVDGLTLQLVRDADGLALPASPPESKREAQGDGRDVPEDAPPPPEPAGIVLGIRAISLRDATITVEDRTVRPAVTSRLAGIDVSLRATGSGSERRITGDVDVAESEVALSGLALRGPLSGRLASEDLLAGSGDFELDATEAELRYGGDFVKPAGTKATLRGVLVRAADGSLGADDLEIAVRNLVATGSLRTDGGTRLALVSEPFAIDGWERLVPPLGVAPPTGRVAITDLVVRSDFAATRGRFALDEIAFTPPGSGPFVFTGELVLAGASLFARDALLLAAEQPFVVSPKVEGLGADPRFELRFATEGASSDALLSAFAGQPDKLHGPLVAKGTLRAPLAGERPLLQRLAGDVEFGIAQGRLVGASLLEAALGDLGARLAQNSRARGSDAWERFTSETFEELSGKVRLEDGRLVTEPVTLAYRDYGVRLEGPMQLPDFELDLRGALSIGPALDAELARAFEAPADYVPERRELVLQSVRGTPTNPKVQLGSKSLTTLAAHYVKSAQREDLKRAVEKELGPGSGEIVERGLDVLEGLLGGKR